MDWNEVVKMIEESNRKVDEVLKAAKLQRNERQPMSMERLAMILNYVMGGMAMTFGFIAVVLIIYFMGRQENFMYIPEFWCGFIAGAIVTIVGIIVWAVWCSAKTKN